MIKNNDDFNDMLYSEHEVSYIHRWCILLSGTANKAGILLGFKLNGIGLFKLVATTQGPNNQADDDYHKERGYSKNDCGSYNSRNALFFYNRAIQTLTRFETPWYVTKCPTDTDTDTETCVAPDSLLLFIIVGWSSRWVSAVVVIICSILPTVYL